MAAFDETIEQMAALLHQTEGTTILIGVTGDSVLRDHAVEVLRARIAPLELGDLRYDAEHLSLLEAAAAETGKGGRAVVSLTGLERLPRDKRTEAIKLLNLQRNRFGRTGVAVILWVDHASLAEVATWSADFYSWRSGTFFLEPPDKWDALASARRGYLEAVLADTEYVNLQGLAPMRGGQIVQMRTDDIFIPLFADEEVERWDIEADDFLWGADPGDVSGPASNGGAGGGHEGYREVGLLFRLRAAPEEPRGASGPALTAGDAPRLPDRGPEEVAQPITPGEAPDEPAEPIGLMTHSLRGRSERLAAGEPFGSRAGPKLRRVDVPELLRESRAVVLGDPGAGKTTLLRYVAREVAQSQMNSGRSDVARQAPAVADCLPVYVKIGEYAQRLREHPEERIDHYAPENCRERNLPLTEALLEDAMADGKLLWLLDGLDEVIHPDQRREVARRVEQFAAAHPASRILVTSRVVGYREAPLAGSFSQFTIRPFENAEIERFARNWYTALGQPERAAALVDAVAEPNIRRLASNPLLITVIALIHWRGTKLPSHRVDLYRAAAETLVDQWMSQRRVTPEGWDVPETRQVLLPAVGWHLHSTSPSGLVGKDELLRVLVETLVARDKQLSANEARARAEQFQRNVSEFSGIFLERGLDADGRGIYGFLHLTFEEYFAGLRLADTWEREGSVALKPLLHDPRWTEPILLAAGHLGASSQHRATQFVRTILEADSDYEDILHRDLRLAARWLADDVLVDPELRHTIVARLVDLYFAKASPAAVREDIRTEFARLGGTTGGREVLTALRHGLNAPEGYVRGLAAEALRELGSPAATPEVLAALVNLLVDPELAVRSSAAVALGQMGSAAASSEVLAALVKLLADPDWHVRDSGAEALGRMGPAAATPELFAALLKIVGHPEGYARRAAAEGLGQIGSAAGTPEVLAALLKLLADREGSVRAAAATALRRLGPVAATPEVLAVLLKLLAGPEGGGRVSAARVLGGMGAAAAAPEVLAALVKLLADRDRAVRYSAAGALGQMGSAAAAPEVLAALLNLSADRDGRVRASAAGALGQMGSAAATPKVLAALVKLLADHEEHVRKLAAEALGRLSSRVAPSDRAAALEFFARLDRSRSDVRSVAYVGLRNLLAAGAA